MAELTLQQQVQKSLDYMSVQNVMGMHMYYHSIGKHGEELEKIWSRKQTDVSFGQNDNFFIGMPSIKYQYVDWKERNDRTDLENVARLYPDIEVKPENYGIGTCIVHPLTSPILEIAGDGKTAKGIWYSPGQVTTLDKNGKPQAQIMWEKYGVDFIKEDGEWKIWHIHMYYDFSAPLGKSWTEPPSNPVLTDQGHDPNFPKPDLVVSGIYERYSPKRVPKGEPRPPEPYYTFNETFSYGPPAVK